MKSKEFLAFVPLDDNFYPNVDENKVYVTFFDKTVRVSGDDDYCLVKEFENSHDASKFYNKIKSKRRTSKIYLKNNGFVEE